MNFSTFSNFLHIYYSHNTVERRRDTTSSSNDFRTAYDLNVPFPKYPQSTTGIIDDRQRERFGCDQGELSTKSWRKYFRLACSASFVAR